MKKENAPAVTPSHNIWHAAFFEAIQLELEDYKDALRFIFEHQLNTDPLRIDVLIIKKIKDIVIKKNIGAIFRDINIIEYKSPGDRRARRRQAGKTPVESGYAAPAPHHY